MDQRNVSMMTLALVVGTAFAAMTACGSSSNDATPETTDGPDAATKEDGYGALGSTPDGSARGAAPTTVDQLTLDPPSATLSVDGTTTKTQTFTAHGSLGGGAPFAVPAVFTIDNAAPGSIDASSGLYTTNNQAGGVVHVTAAYGSKTATATLTVVLTQEATSGGAVPTDPGSFFGPPNVVKADPAHAPSLVYPAPDTMFPQNVYRVLFQWNRGRMSLYQLEFQSPVLTYRIYTDGAQATCATAATGGGCWESDPAVWTTLAASNAGQAVKLTIRATNPSAPGTVFEAGPYTIHFSQDPVPGALYYWSTTVAGVRRGALGDSAPQNFLTPNEAQGKCVACHTLSRNGKRMAADVGGENLTVVDVSPTPPPPALFGTIAQPATTIPSSWATFNPDTTRVVSSTKGVLKLFDGATGAPIGANSGVIPLGAGNAGQQPDWAPDGKHLVFGMGNADRKGATRIGWMTASGDTFSGLEVLLAATGNETFGYPMFNPSSEWISFSRGTAGVERDGTDEVYVLRAAPGSTPQQLVRADTLVNDTSVTTGIENNMPTWAPTTNGGIQWIAFASLRDYGFVLRNGSKIGSKMQQLWIAAIDTSKLGSGDPSYPAFRVPFVDLEENCHRPFWAEDAVKPPTPTDAGVPDAAPPACVDLHADCTSARCCGSLVCTNVNGNYTCEAQIY